MTHQVTSVRTYVLVFAALIALTATTVAVSKLELGEYNFICAMTIAVIKGTLVVMFFMHVKKSSSMTKLFVAAGLSWMVILVVFVLSDYLSRGWLPSGRWWSSAAVLPNDGAVTYCICPTKKGAG
jgi:cytochrome c oxidase subunit 4